MFQATRRRLAIWYTAVTAVLLLLFASGVYLYVRSTLVERIDDTLNHVVEVVERSLVIDPAYPDAGQLGLNLKATFQDNAETVEDDHIDLEWFSPTGELVWSTLSAPLNIPIHLNRTGETVRVTWSDANPTTHLTPNSSLLLRQVTARVQAGRQVIGYLRVSHPWFEVTKPSQQLAIDLSLGIGLMLLSVALCGWFLSGKAIEPVRDSYSRLKQFTADASHELRSPITLIQTNVQVALTELESNGGEATSKYKQQLKVVERLTKRLGRLVDDLLFLARQDSGIVQTHFSSCPLDALLMEVIEEQQLAATQKNIKLLLDLIEPSPTDITPEPEVEDWFTLQGDWNQLVRLFTNLIGNAVQYTPNGGQIDVELKRTSTSKEISLSPLAPRTKPQATRLQVKVKDTGIGIPPSALPHLFDRFYRVDPARTRAATTKVETSTGTGLGLAIAAAIVANHGGQIHTESTQGQGTTFTLTLPLNVED